MDPTQRTVACLDSCRGSSHPAVSIEGVAEAVGSSWGAARQRITGDEGVKTSIPAEKVQKLER